MAVKKYSYSKQGDTRVSAHTKVKELVSKSGSKVYSDTVLVDEDLMIMIEKLFAKLHCKKYIISSGYRTVEHDRAVGGSGKGQHTKGKAVDACFYDKNGKIISAKIVCCVAQDLGFNGIANISNKYQYVHLDTRDSGKYKGDEIKGTNSVTTDFYKYFSVSKADVAKYTGEAVATTVKVNYYPKYTGKSAQVDVVFKTIGVPSAYYGSWTKRKPIAKANGIGIYIGSASQNNKLINLAKQGKLIKP